MASASKRVQQWLTFGRVWWLFDAKWQDPLVAAPVLCKYLKGSYKPIYGGYPDCGDHVVIINTQDIALKSDEWFYRVYFHHTGYPGGATFTKAWELHKKDPTLIVFKAVYRELGGNYERRHRMARCHIYPDDNVPDQIMENVTDQIPRLRTIPKRIDEYTDEEIRDFPKLFDYPKDYVLK